MIRDAVQGKKTQAANFHASDVLKKQKSELDQLENTGANKEVDIIVTSHSASLHINSTHANVASNLFSKLLKKRQSLQSTRWSISELQINSLDLQELVEWLKAPEQFEINEAFERGWSKTLDPSRQYTNKVVVGLLLHALYAETVRRDGTEGSYWSCVYQRLPWKESNRHHLFQYNGQPSPFHRELLENSAQALKLRHTFGIDGVQNWFSTGFLQFGFTHQGFKRRLGEWLAGYHISTNAIEALCVDQQLCSSSFQQL